MLGLALIGPASQLPRAERPLTNATELAQQVHPGPRISRISSRLGIVDFSKEPGAGEGPIAFRGTARDVQQVGRLVNGQAGEIAEFDQFSLGRLAGGESGQVGHNSSVYAPGTMNANSIRPRSLICVVSPDGDEAAQSP